MAAKRRKRSHKGQQEDELLRNQRWSGLREQARLQSLHHTVEENKKAKQRCLALINRGHGSIDWD